MGLLGFFNYFFLYPFDRNMALGSTQPLTEVSTKDFPWGVKAAGV
jgi:hypothetical protein